MKKITSILLAVIMVFGLLPFSALAVFEMEKGQNIEFAEYYFDTTLQGNDKASYLIRCVEELNDFVYMCEGSSFASFASELEDGYFQEKNLVVYYGIVPIDTQYDITGVEVTRNGVDLASVTIRYDFVKGFEATKRGRLMIAEVNASDIADVEMIKSIRNDVYTDVIPFEDQIFEISGYNSMDNLTLYIDNLSQLDELKKYRDATSKRDYDNYLATLDEGFFQTKSIIAIINVLTSGGHKFDVLNVSANDQGISLKYIYDNHQVGTDDMQYTCIIIEVNKSDIKSSEKINVTYHSDGSVYIPPYTPAVFGDVDGNSKLSAYDYMFLKMIIMGEIDESITCEFGNYIPRSDINGDGKLTAIDYMLLKSAILGQYELPQ